MFYKHFVYVSLYNYWSRIYFYNKQLQTVVSVDVSLQHFMVAVKAYFWEIQVIRKIDFSFLVRLEVEWCLRLYCFWSTVTENFNRRQIKLTNFSPMYPVLLLVSVRSQFTGCDYFQNAVPGQTYDVFSPGYGNYYQSGTNCRKLQVMLVWSVWNKTKCDACPPE